MNNIVLMFHIALLFLVLVLGTFQWLYVKEARKVSRQLGIIFPDTVEKLLSLSVVLPIIVLPIIVLFILFSL